MRQVSADTERVLAVFLDKITAVKIYFAVYNGCLAAVTALVDELQVVPRETKVESMPQPRWHIRYWHVRQLIMLLLTVVAAYSKMVDSRRMSTGHSWYGWPRSC